MKERIKKWLGITRIEDKIAEIKLPTDAELRRMVGHAVFEALEGKSDSCYFLNGRYTEIKNMLLYTIESAATTTAKAKAVEATENHLSTETFIDSVVERIKRKQLSYEK